MAVERRAAALCAARWRRAGLAFTVTLLVCVVPAVQAQNQCEATTPEATTPEAPQDARARETNAQVAALLRRAEQSLQSGDDRAALGHGLAAANLTGDNWPLINLAAAARKAARYDMSLDVLAEVRRRKGTIGATPVVWMPYHYHRARALLALRRTAEAIDELTLGLIVQPSYGYAWLLRARALEALGRKEMAGMDVAMAIAAQPAGGFDQESQAFIRQLLEEMGEKLGDLGVGAGPLGCDAALSLRDAVSGLDRVLKSVKLPALPTQPSSAAAVSVTVMLTDAKSELHGMASYLTVEIAPGVRYFVNSVVRGDDTTFREAGVSAGPVSLAYNADWARHVRANGALFSLSAGFTSVEEGPPRIEHRCRPAKSMPAASLIPALRGEAALLTCLAKLGDEEPLRIGMVFLDAYRLHLHFATGAGTDGVEERIFLPVMLHVVGEPIASIEIPPQIKPTSP